MSSVKKRKPVSRMTKRERAAVMRDPDAKLSDLLELATLGDGIGEVKERSDAKTTKHLIATRNRRT